ncbi:MAG: hypothetical protein AABZ06_13025 [Bdellovibrionota bacterium]
MNRLKHLWRDGLLVGVLSITVSSPYAWSGRSAITYPVVASSRSVGEGGPSGLGFNLAISLTNLSDKDQNVVVSVMQPELFMSIAVMNCDPEYFVDNKICREIKRCDNAWVNPKSYTSSTDPTKNEVIADNKVVLATRKKNGDYRAASNSAYCDSVCSGTVTKNCREWKGENARLRSDIPDDNITNYYNWSDENFLTALGREAENTYGRLEPPITSWAKYSSVSKGGLVKKVNFYTEPTVDSDDRFSFAFENKVIKPNTTLKLSATGYCYFKPDGPKCKFPFNPSAPENAYLDAFGSTLKYTTTLSSTPAEHRILPCRMNPNTRLYTTYTPCVYYAGVEASMSVKVNVTEDRGAILGSVQLTPSISAPGSDEGSPSGIPINGGRPF